MQLPGKLGLRILAVVLIIQLNHWTTRSGNAVTAASMKPPGETTPTIIEIEIGDSANITCHIVGGGNSSTIWFSEPNYKTRIVQPSTQITILDSQTAVLMIRNATEHMGQYHCMSGDNAIGMTRVYVGTHPINVADYSCINFDYEYLTCNFTKPHNNILTLYTLNYTTESPENNMYFECKLFNRDDDPYTYCNITMNGTRRYYPSREMYHFNLTATNVLGTISQQFPINNYALAVPAKLNVTAQHITNDTVTLFWKFLNSPYYEAGLEYEIRVQPSESQVVLATNETDMVNKRFSKSNNCTVQIQLEYPYWSYNVAVRVRTRTKYNLATMWSKSCHVLFRTEPSEPKVVPSTAVGSFYINNEEIRLYWPKLEERDENGPDFHYAILSDSGTMYTNETSFTLPPKSCHPCTHYIKSMNSMGSSYASGLIRTYDTLEDHSPKTKTIEAVYHNGAYTLSWKAPANQFELQNYTVFWCKWQLESTNQCKGAIHFEYIDAFQTNFTKATPQDVRLNFAISANYPNYSSGMHWAMCKDDSLRELIQIEPKASVLSASAIHVQWNTGGVCTSTLEGYNLTYCQVNDLVGNCTSPSVTIPIRNREYRNYTIKNLKPYSLYRIEMLMYSKSAKPGPISKPLYRKTLELAPSEPKNLTVQVNSVTSNSAVISWQSPTEANGLLRYYTIWKIRYMEDQHNTQCDTIIVNITNKPYTYSEQYTLESLNSYSKYEIYITAHTGKDESLRSNRSNIVHFSTLIGSPTSPRQVKIVENDSYKELQWDRPEMPSGRVEFYVVKMRMRRNRSPLEDDIEEKVAIVPGNKLKCRYSPPDCYGSKYSYTMMVRAVNMAEEHEIDRSTFPIAKSAAAAVATKRRRHTSPEISSTVVGGIQSTYNVTEHHYRHGRHEGMKASNAVPIIVSSSRPGIGGGHHFEDWDIQLFNCIGDNWIDPRFNAYTRHINDVTSNFFSSQWESAQLEILCPQSHIYQVLIILAAVIASFVSVAIIMLYLYNKWKQMKNIKAVLPEGLVDKHFGGGGGNGCDDVNSCIEKNSSVISGSIDYVAYQQKENRQLLAPIRNSCANVINSLTSISSGKKINDIQNDTHSLEGSNEEQSSQSTDSVELNDVSSSSFSHSPVRNMKATTGLSEYQQTPLQMMSAVPKAFSGGGGAGGGGGGGYVTPSIMMFETNRIVNGTTPSGYVMIPQLQQQQLNAANGYTTVDAITQPSPSPSIATAPNVVVTSPVVPPAAKLQPVQSLQVAVSPPRSNNADNNSSSICGYVTQRQLAEFGQLLH